MTRADDWFEPTRDDYDPLADDPRWNHGIQDEPFCGACGDNGCRMCQPSRFYMWRSGLRWWLRDLADRVRGRNNQLPF